MKTRLAVGALTLAAVAAAVTVARSGDPTPRDAKRGAAALQKAGEASTTTVYTANHDDETASVLDGSTLSRVVPDIELIVPNSISVSSDGARVYAGVDDGAVEVIDAATNTRVTSVPLSGAVTDIAVSPDGTKVYAALAAGSVVVVDTVALSAGDSFPLPSQASNTPRPVAIDVTPDGQSLFVLDTNDVQVVKLRASDGASQGTVGVSTGAVELKVSHDGATVIVVGDEAAQFFSTSDLSPVVGTSPGDLGDEVDVATAGTHAYALNTQFVQTDPQPFAKVLSRPKLAVVTPQGASIDVYDASTGDFVKAIALPTGIAVLGIAVTSDESTAYVSYSTSENHGSVIAVDVATGATGPTGTTGQSPVRVAVREATAIPIVSYFLPRVVIVQIKGAGKDRLVASGFYDDGGATVDYSQSATISVGGYSQSFTLVPNAARTQWKFRSPDKTLQLRFFPNLKHSSRGKFVLQASKTTLNGLIDPNAPVEFHFTAAGLPDAEGEVTLQQGRYRLNHTRGDLALPQFYPASIKTTLPANGKDSILFKGGFATVGGIPTELTATVRFGFGAYSRAVAGSLFTGGANGLFKYSDKNGKSKFSMQIDYAKELVTVSATNVALGFDPGDSVNATFDAGNGAGTFENTIRMSDTSPTHPKY